jgi:hypothetical protein
MSFTVHKEIATLVDSKSLYLMSDMVIITMIIQHNISD